MALSTPQARSDSATISVIYPVTPNGVEHNHNPWTFTFGNSVIYPVTPNGVEHNPYEGGDTYDNP